MRTAIVDVDPELLREVLAPLLDAGVRITGSLDAFRDQFAPIVRLIVSGEALPEECERAPDDRAPLRRVKPLFRVAQSGKSGKRTVSLLRCDIDPDFRFDPPAPAF